MSSATTGDDLATLFGEFGTVSSAKVIMDKETGNSKCFGFVEMEDETEGISGKGTFVKSPDKNMIMEQYRQRRLAEFSRNAEALLSEGLTEEELINAIKTINERK